METAMLVWGTGMCGGRGMCGCDEYGSREMW